MRNYEVTFIVDPVLSSSEIDATAKNYEDHLKKQGCDIVHHEAMGLKQLAYPISKRTSGVYFCVEFKTDTHAIIEGLELALRRDERIIRFLTVKLDKYGVKYNDDKRKGLIGKPRNDEAPAKSEKGSGRTGQDSRATAPSAASAPAAVASDEEE